MSWRNRQFESIVTGFLLMPVMLIAIVGLFWLTRGWVLLAYPLLFVFALLHDFSPWWPSKTHCMTCIERSRSAG